MKTPPLGRKCSRPTAQGMGQSLSRLVMINRILFVLAFSVALLLVFGVLVPDSKSEGAAFNISYSETCYGDKADVTFRWQGANASSQQWLDLSLQDNGWRDGTFIGVGPLAGTDASFVWIGLVGNSPHVLRINQLIAGRWDVSQTFRFTPCSVGCPAGGCHVYPSCPYVIKGNISFNTGERIYHVPGGNFYNATVISPSQGERWFCSEQEARAAGWRRSSN